MPDNIANLIDKIPVELMAPLMAMISSYITIMHKKNCRSIRFTRKILEAVVCGCFGLTAHYGLVAIGVEATAPSLFACLMIGNLGSSNVRSFAMTLIKRQLEINEKEKTKDED